MQHRSPSVPQHRFTSLTQKLDSVFETLANATPLYYSLPLGIEIRTEREDTKGIHPSLARRIATGDHSPEEVGRDFVRVERNLGSGKMGTFVRSPSVPKGVRARFSTFRIEDIPDDKRKEAIQHMKDFFFKDEPTTQILRKTTPLSDEDIDVFLNNALNDNVSLCAFDEANNDEIAGVTILRVSSRCDPHRHEKVDSKLKSLERLFNFLHHCHEGIDPFTYKSGSKEVVVDHVLEPMGLSVSSHYRGKGIGQALIQARHKLAAELGIGATMGIYTSIYSQAIILRQGMELVKEISYNEYKEDGKVIFAELNPPHPSAKVIGGLIKKD